MLFILPHVSFWRVYNPHPHPHPHSAMEKYSYVCYALVALLVIVCIRIYYDSDAFQLKCVLSSKDGNRYCVREREKLELAADLLAEVTEKCKLLVRYLGEKYPDNKKVQRLVKGFNPKRISETLPTSELTAYSENKGEKIAFCLNTTKEGNQLIDLNTLTFVAFHELAHIMTVSIGHKQEFWDNFKFLLVNAKEAHLYNPEDYKKHPREYCGMTISDNPLFDM